MTLRKTQEADFKGLVQAYVAVHNCSKADAVRAVGQKFPEKRAEYIKAANVSETELKNLSDEERSFFDLINEYMKQGLSKIESLKKVRAEYPDKHLAYLKSVQR